MKTAIALVLAAFVSVASAEVQPGRLYEHTPTHVLADEAERLMRFPASIGQWELQSDGEPLDEGVQQELGLENYISRIYRNPATDQQVALLLMLGSPGRLVRHPPDICYTNRGSRSLSTDEILIDNDGVTHHFRSLAFVGEDALEKANEFVVAYGHTAQTQWDVPRFPRFTYGSEPFLYKMQVLVGEGDSNEERSQTARMFLTDYVKSFTTMKNAKS